MSARNRRRGSRFKRLFNVEQLESRVVPAGGLSYEDIANGVLINSGPAAVTFEGLSPFDTPTIQSFFSKNGNAGSITVPGVLSTDGESVTGTFTFSEFGPTGGVAVLASQATVQFGDAAGIRLSNADGGFAILDAGLAGQLVALDMNNFGVDAHGLKGLDLNAADGMTFRLNTTGQAVSKTVPAPGPAIEITFADAKPVKQIDGAADFRVSGASGTLARFGGKFVATEADDVLELAAEQLTTDFYVGTVRAVTIGSVEAAFTLNADAFALADSLPVNEFFPLPIGKPIAADAGDYGGGLSAFNVPLGPLQIVGLAPVVNAASFGPAGLDLDIGLTAQSASVTFGKPGSGETENSVYARAEGLTGTFQLVGDVDPNTGVVTKLTAPGKFAIEAESFELNVPKVLNASATALAITYDPSISGPQQIVSAEEVTVLIPALKLQGDFAPSDSTPGLVVYTDGFAFGDGKVSYQGDLKFGSFATIENPFVRLGDFSYRNSTGPSLGLFGVGADGVDIEAAGGKFKMSSEELEAAVTFDSDYRVSKFTLSAGTVTAEFGDYVSIAATGVEFTPTAQGGETLLKLDTGEATLNIAPIGLKLRGVVEPLSISGDGHLTGPDKLRLGMSFKASDATSLRWPAVIPITINQLDLVWPEFRANPRNFQIELSAGIDADFGGVSGLRISGGVDRVVIDPYRLADKGQNPIVAIDGFSAKIKGNLFGGGIEAGVIVGIVHLDAEGNQTTFTNAADHVFYGAFQGGFTFANMETELRLGFSERGLLQGYLGAATKIVLDPISGLSISQVRGAITFHAPSLERPADPTELAAPAYKPTSALTQDEWQAQLKQAVINQVTEGSRIFVIDADLVAVAAALGEEGIEFGTDNALLAAFDEAGYEVASEGTPGEIRNLVPGRQWLITHVGQTYIVEKNGDGEFEVTLAQFVLPDLSLLASLGVGTVSPAVVQAFLENNIELDPNSQVSVAVEEIGRVTKWRIEGGGAKYFVTVRGDTLAVTGSGAGFDTMNDLVRIEIGATLTTYAPVDAFVADVDIVISTEGRFMVVGRGKAAGITADIRMFFDLSQAGRPHPEEPLSILFLADIGQPETTGQTNTTSKNSPAPVRISGVMTFEFLDANDNLMNPLFGGTPAAFRFRLLGRAEAEPVSGVKIVFGGDRVQSGDPGSDETGYAEVSLIIRDQNGDKSVKIDVSGSLSVEGFINAKDVLSAAGTLILEDPADGPFSVVGAVKLDFGTNSKGLTFLKNAGLTAAQADLTFAFNSSKESKELTLRLPGRDEETLFLAPTSLELDGTGTLRFDAGVALFKADLAFDGAFAIRMAIDSAAPTEYTPDRTLRGDGGLDLDIFLAARLDAGVSVGGPRLNFITFDGMGLIAIRDVGAKDQNGNWIAPTVAGRVDLFVARNVPGVLQIDGSGQLMFNSSGDEFVYVVPERIADTLRAIQARRLNVDPAEVQVPALAAVRDENGVLVVTVPNAPPHIDGIADVSPGPFFLLQLGDPTESPGFGGNPDPNGNGLVDATITLFNAYQLNGDARIVVSGDGFVMMANAQTRIALPGAEALFRGSVAGALSITRDGLYGALGSTRAIELDINSFKLGAGVQAFLGINTTGQDKTLDLQVNGFQNPTLLARSASVSFKGGITIGGFGLTGQYKLSAGAQAIRLGFDAAIKVFDIEGVRVSGDAAIYYGAPDKTRNGLVLDTALAIAPIGVAIDGFKLFEIGGSFGLHLDTRPASARFEVTIDNAHVTLLDALHVSGSARLIAVAGTQGQEGYLRVEGNFSGRLLGIVSVDASGFFDSRGYFGVNISAGVKLGSDSFGFRASGSMFIERSPAVPLDFGAQLSAQVRAFGITVLGAGVTVDYDGYGPFDTQTGRITAAATVTVLGFDATLKFTVGYLRLKSFSDPGLAQIGPDGTLVLNVGDRAQFRDPSVSGGADEAYTIESLGASANGIGEDVRISAFGTSQTFGSVRRIVGDFGSGNDQFVLAPGFTRSVAVAIQGGAGNDLLINQSNLGVEFYGGAGNDTLLSNSAARLDGEADNDVLAGGAGSTLLGGSGDDAIDWQLDLGRPGQIDGGSGNDTLSVTGTDLGEGYTVGAQGSSLLLDITGNAPLTASGIEKLSLNGRGGADVLTVNLSGLPQTGLTAISADLTHALGKATPSGDVPVRDDGAADRVVVIGTDSRDAFNITARGGDAVVVFEPAFEIAIVGPNRAGDTLEVFGQGDDDTFAIAGSLAESAGRLVGISLDGGSGNDTATLPIGGATFQGGSGSNSVRYTVHAGDDTSVTITGASVRSGNGTSVFANVDQLTLDTTVAATVNVASTIAGQTTVNLGRGGTVNTGGNTGPLTVNLLDGGTVNSTGNVAALDVNLTRDGKVYLAATGAPVTVTGQNATLGQVILGNGLLDGINAVTVNSVRTVILDDSLDAVSRSASITDQSVVIGGLPLATSFNNVNAIQLRTGSGNDSAVVRIGTASVTFEGGAGVDRLTANLFQPLDSLARPLDAVSVIGGESVESVVFNQYSQQASGRAQWFYNTTRLSAYASPENTRELLLAGYSASVVLNLIGTNDSVEIRDTMAPLAVYLPGGNNAVTVGSGIGSLVLLHAASAGNTLTYDDAGTGTAPAGVLRATAVSADHIRTPGGQSIRFDRSLFGNLSLRFGGANDAVSLRDLPGQTHVTGGNGDDLFTVGGGINALTIEGGGGNDTATVTPGTGALTFTGDGGTLDRLILDRSDAVNPVNGSLSSNDGSAVASLAGLPDAAGDAEYLQVNLGAGNDTFTVDALGLAPHGIDVYGNAGDDTVTLLSIDPAMAPNSFTVFGDGPFGGTGRDTVTAVIPGLPQANQFAPVVPKVERLVIDHRTGTQPVAWQTKGPNVYGNGHSIINSEGADRVELIGGTALGDTLQVTGSDPARPLDVAIVGNTVNVYEGLNVLSQSTPAAATPRTDTVVQGLSGNAQPIVTDGRLIFVSNNDSINPLISIFRVVGPGQAPVFLRTIAIPAITFPGGHTAQDWLANLAVRPDGGWLFVTTHFNRLLTYQIENNPSAPNGVAVMLRGDTPSLTEGVFVKVSPDGQALALSDDDYDAYTFDISALSPANPTPTLTSHYFTGTGSGSLPRLAGLNFSSDSQFLYLWNASNIYVLQRQPDGGYAYQRSVQSDPGLYLPFSSDIQFSADGSVFFAYEASAGRFFYYDVSDAPDTRELVLRGQLDGVQTAPVYDSPTGTLVTVRNGERQFLRANPATGLFEVVASAAVSGTVSSIDIAVAGGTRYAVFTSPSSAAGSTVYWHDLNGPDLAAGQSLPFITTGSYSEAVAVTDGTAGEARLIVARRNPDVPITSGPYAGGGYYTMSTTYLVVDPATGAVLSEYTSSNPTLPGRVHLVDLKVHGTGDARGSVVWAIERGDPWYGNNGTAGMTTLIRVYRVEGGALVPVQTVDLSFISFASGVGFFSDSPDITSLRFSPDGRTAYLDDSHNYPQFSGATSRTWTLQVGLDGLSTDPGTGPQNSQHQAPHLGERFTNIAFRGDDLFGTRQRQVFGPNGTVWSNGDGRFVFSSTSPYENAVRYVEASEDGSALYVSTTGNPDPFNPNAQDGTFFAGSSAQLNFVSTLRQYTRPDGSVGDFEDAEFTLDTNYFAGSLTRVGRQLYAPVNGRLRRIDLGTPNGDATGVAEVSSVTTGNRAAFVNGTFYGVTDPVFNGSAFVASLAGLPLAANGTFDSARSTRVLGGQIDTRSVAGAKASAVSPNGRYYYALSPNDDGLAVYDTQTQTWKTFFDIFDVATATLDGVAAIVVSEANGVQYAMIVSPLSGALTTLATTPNGVTTVIAQVARPEFVGVTSLAYSVTDQALYTLTAGELRRYSLPPTLTGVGASSPPITGSQMTAVRVGNGRVYVVGDNGTTIRAYGTDLSGPLAAVSGLSHVTDLAFFGDSIYASSSDGTVYQLRDTGAAIVLLDTVRNNANGVRGIGGASAVELSADGAYVFVAGQTDNSVAVFLRDPATGTLRYVQSVLDGRGARGIFQPTGLAVANGQLIVSSGTARDGTRGGFVALDIAPVGTSQPARVDLSHTRIESLTVVGSNADDAVRLIRSPDAAETETAVVVPVAINTLGGGDLVAVSDTGSAATLTIDTGAGDDALTIGQAAPRSVNQTVTVATGDGSDSVSVQQLSSGVSLSIDLSGDGGTTDIVQVRGAGVPLGSSVVVRGEVGTSTQPKDALFYFGEGASLVGGDATNGTITRPGSGDVAFSQLNRGAPDQQVFIVASPRPRITGLPTIAEGQGVTLAAVDDAGLSNVTFAWDLDGDGLFGDATGPTVILTWAQLQQYGIDDNGAYPVAVRATTANNPIQFGGKAYSLSADANAMFTVTNTTPTIATWGTQATLGVTFTVPLQVVSEPGDDRVGQWVVNWGDGTPNEVYGSVATSASHVYTRPGDFTVTVVPVDEDFVESVTLDYYVRQTVQVRPGAGTVGLDLSANPIAEGDGLTFTARAVGTPARYLWDFGANGSTEFTTTSPTLGRTWAELNALGVNDNGAYTVRVTAIYSDGATEYPASSPSVTVTVTNAAPTGTLTLSASSVNEGSPLGALTATVTNYADPAAADTAATARVDYDFNNDGTIDLIGQPIGATVNVPASVFTTAGVKTIRAVLHDKDGASVVLFATVRVAELPTTLTVDPVAGINEGDTASVTVRASDPGGVAINSWRLDWSDGTIETVVGNGTAIQTFTHRYANGGVGGTNFPISITARTPGGDVTADASARVFDVAPTVTLTTPNAVTVEGSAAQALVVDLSVTDAGADPVTGYVIAWGDGTTDTYTGDATQVSHIYSQVPAGGLAAVRVTALTNGDGVFANPSNTLMVTVANSAPQIASFELPAFGSEGAPFDFTALVTSVAVGSETLTFQWTVTAPGGQTVTLPAAMGDAVLADAPLGVQYAARHSASFTPANNGLYTITLTVTDDDGGSVTASRTIDVLNVDPTIISYNAPETGDEGHAVTFTASASDAAGPADPLTYSWSVVNVTTNAVVATQSGSQANFVATLPGGEYVVTLTVTDGDGGSDTRSSALSVLNTGPRIVTGSLIVPTTSREADTSSFSVVGADDGGAAGLQYRWTILGPDGLATYLDGAQAAYRWPDDGVYRVSVTITDGDGQSVSSAPVEVAVANLPPMIALATAPATGFEGVALGFSASATDPAGIHDALRFTWTITNAAGQATTVYGSTANYTPPDNGTYTVDLTVDDFDGGSDSRRVGTIVVNNIAPGAGGIVIPVGPINEGQTITLSVSHATDVAADLPGLTYAWVVTSPSGSFQTFTGTSITVPVGDNGVYGVQLTVTDKDGGQVVRTASFTAANLAPVFGSATIPPRGYVNRPVALTASASDYDALTYTWTISGPTGTVQRIGSSAPFTPTVSGSYLVSLTVSDGQGGTVSASGSVTVVDSPVTIGSVTAPTNPVEASAVRLQATASDELGGVPTFTWTITPQTGPAVTRSGADVTFTPADNGSYTVTLVVTTANGTATRTFPLAVANLPPQISLLSIPTGLTTGSPATVSAAATDPAGLADPLTFTWTITRPDNTVLTFTGESASFTPMQVGTYDVRLSVSDGDGGVATATRFLAVTNAPPRASAGGPYSVNEGGSVQLSGLGSFDPNQASNTLTYAWDLDGNGVFGESSTPFGDERGATPIFLAANLDGPTQRTVRVRVTDAGGTSDVASAVVTVANVAPVVSPLQLSASPISENGSVTVTGTFTDFGLNDTHTLTIVWGDGTPNSVVSLSQGSRSFSVGHQYRNNPTGQPNGSFTIVATVADDDGASGFATKAVTVRNVAPQSVSISGLAVAVPGLAVSYVGAFTDPGSLDTHTQQWRVARTSSPNVTLASGTGANFAFTPGATGTYTVTYTVTDSDGGTTSTSLTLTVTPTKVINGVLYVGGTDSADEIEVSRSGSNIRVEIETDCDRTVYTVPAAGVTKVVVFALGCDDEVEVASSLGTLPTELYGGSGDDELEGGLGNDLLDGGAGNDELRAEYGNDTLLGGDGCDELRAGQGNDLLDGGAGNDKIIGRSGQDTLRGGTGDDEIYAGSGRDQLFGDDGNDCLVGGSGGDVLDGGAGNDRIWAGSGGDTVTGGAGNDTLYAGSGSDRLYAGDGNDTLYGSSGCDVLDGGAGDDLINSGSGGDTVTGGAGNDTICGGSGNDSLDGGDGDDRIFGGSGNDTLVGGAGNDSLDGESGNDSVTGGAGNDTLVGGTGADALLGGDGDDTFLGWDGIFVDDVLSGGAGADRIASPSNDSGALSLTAFTPAMGIELIVGRANSTNWIEGTSGNNTLDFSTTELQNLGYVDGGSGNDLIVGSPFGAGLEYRGGAGNDTLVSGQPADRLRGNSGNDVFRIATWTTGAPSDQILDFAKGSDKVDLRLLGIRSSNARTVTRVGSDTVLTITLPPLNGQSRTLTLRFVGYTGTLDLNDFIFAV